MTRNLWKLFLLMPFLLVAPATFVGCGPAGALSESEATQSAEEQADEDAEEEELGSDDAGGEGESGGDDGEV